MDLALSYLVEAVTAALVACGVAYVLVDSKVFSVPRKYLRRKLPRVTGFLDCYACSGFWAGVWFYAALFYQRFLDAPVEASIKAVAAGFLACAWARTWDVLVLFLVRHSAFPEEDGEKHGPQGRDGGDVHA